MTNTLFDYEQTTERPGLKLLDLKLRNFKGIRKFDLKADGNNLDIHGDNATGKSTLFDAYSWLLFGKDSLNQGNFEIKTLDENNEPIHGLEHEVEGVFSANGRTITLKKVYKEVWSTPRKEAKKVLTRHTTDHFWDGTPVSQTEYNKRIAGIVDENIFRLLSDPAFFNDKDAFPWPKRRALLLEVCGDITDDGVIDSSDKLSGLRKILGDRSLDDLRAMLKARRKAIDKRKEEIPVRISENQMGLPDISGINEEALPGDIEKARAARRAKADEIARAEQGGGVADRVKRLSEIESAMLDLENDLRRKNDLLLGGKMTELRKAEDEMDTLERSLRKIEQELAVNRVDCEQHETAIEQYRQEWFKIDAREFVLNQDSVCPTCGQDLPEHQLEEARQKALEQFNLQKSEDLEKVNESGKQAGARLGQLQVKEEALEKELKDLVKKRLLQKKSAEKLRAEIDKLESQKPDVSKNPEHQKLAEEREKVLYEIGSLKTGNEHALSNLRKELAELDGVVDALEEADKRLNDYKKTLQRIEELMAEERKLSAELEEVDRQLYLTDQFIRTKVSLLEGNINSKFCIARFKMFEIQLNDNVKETCETLVDGVPYSNLNRGAKLNVGLDIIRTLQEHYNFSCPVWVDNAEAVTRLTPMDCQMIRLVVDASAKELDVREVS